MKRNLDFGNEVTDGPNAAYMVPIRNNNEFVLSCNHTAESAWVPWMDRVG